MHSDACSETATMRRACRCRHRSCRCACRRECVLRQSPPRHRFWREEARAAIHVHNRPSPTPARGSSPCRCRAPAGRGVKSTHQAASRVRGRVAVVPMPHSRKQSHALQVIYSPASPAQGPPHAHPQQQSTCGSSVPGSRALTAAPVLGSVLAVRVLHCIRPGLEREPGSLTGSASMPACARSSMRAFTRRSSSRRSCAPS